MSALLAATLLAGSTHVEIVNNLNDGFVAFEDVRYSWSAARSHLSVERRYDIVWRIYGSDDPESFVRKREERRLSAAENDAVRELIAAMRLRDVDRCAKGYVNIDGGPAGRWLSFFMRNGDSIDVGVNDNACARSNHEPTGLVTFGKFANPVYEKLASLLPVPERKETLFRCEAQSFATCHEREILVLDDWSGAERLPMGVLRALAMAGCGAKGDPTFSVSASGSHSLRARWSEGEVRINTAPRTTYSCIRSSTL